MTKAKIILVAMFVSVVIVGAIALTAARTATSNARSEKRIGAILALTGANAELGAKIRLGMELACERHNTQHPEKKLRLLIEDSKSTARDGISAFNKLTELDRCDIVLGNASFLAAALSPIADERGALFVAVASAKPGITENRRLVLRYFPTCDTIAKAVVDYTAVRYHKAAVLHLDDEYANAAMTTFKRETESRGGKCVFVDSFRNGDTEFRTLVQKMLATEPEVVFVPGFGPAFIAVIRAVRQAAPNLPVVGDIPLTVPANIEALGSASEGVIVPTSSFDIGTAETELQKSLLDELHKRQVGRPDVFLSAGFDSVLIVGAAVAATDSTPAAVREFIVKNKHEGVCGDIEYLPNGESIVPVSLLKVQSGKLVPCQ